MTGAATAVLTSVDLMAVLSSFQQGAFCMVLDLTSQIWYAGISPSFLKTFHYCNIERLVHVMTSWYATYDFAASLPKVFRAVPYMRPIVAYEAVYSGNAAVVHLLHRQFGITSFRDPLIDIATYQRHDDEAGRQKQLNMVQLLHFLGHPGCSRAALNHAIDHNHVDLVRFFATHRTEGCDTGLVWASSSLSLEMVQVLHQCTAVRFTAAVMDQAASRGNLKIVQFLHENRREGCSTKAMDWAAGNGYLEMVRFLHDNRTEGCTTKALDDATKHRHWNVARFLIEKRPEGGTALAHHALQKAHQIELLKALRLRHKLSRAEKKHLKLLQEMERLGTELQMCTIT
ncbi:hypothetical protein H310_14363 [Aphanomyces invadans]|uniref:Uncharacterized protein n=1 Tax=Aphanomyces invadans TaxID=157072 RepID=A0A024TAE4_9STRA|nr:hypothetical protein H310_14363 [Aphanomyces invadans]ETV90949.1 hypothetical protein H310_14363 [Aphanomyces invadans]|eukprot:XP_008880431.1 hypothetical protein H310_14363 [Aphanomyces invadans]